jgi:hypothetical protein
MSEIMTNAIGDQDSLRDALNRHGVFLKKAVLAEVGSLDQDNLSIFGEEVGTSSGGTRVADIVAVHYFDGRAKEHPLFFVIECKRTAPGEQWGFFKHIDRHYRVSRGTDEARPFSIARQAVLSHNRVCSEGYEFPGLEKKKTNRPIRIRFSRLRLN